MKTFCFKLYKSERNDKLHKQINAAGLIYNHCKLHSAAIAAAQIVMKVVVCDAIS